jgi:hypothetical protein
MVVKSRRVVFASGALIAAAFVAGAPAAFAETVLYNSNFSTSNPARYSGYASVSPTGITSQGQCVVVSNPASAFGGPYASYYDHTAGDSSGAMLFFNGAGQSASAAGASIWYQDFNLTAGTTYTFSFWGSSAMGANDPTLELMVDGTRVGSMLNTSTAQWTKFTATYTPKSGTTHRFAIRDASTMSFGNDGAIDDVMLSEGGPTPVAAPLPAVAAMGTLLLSGVALGRKRDFRRLSRA